MYISTGGVAGQSGVRIHQIHKMQRNWLGYRIVAGVAFGTEF